MPTPLGITLVRGYQVIDVDLCLPDIRAFIEKQITLIAKGQAEYSRVVRHVLQEFAAKFAYFVAQVTSCREYYGNFRAFSSMQNLLAAFSLIFWLQA